MNKRVLIPSIKNLKVLPPVISWINYLTSNGSEVIVISYNTNSNLFSPSSKLNNINISASEYPKSLLKRIFSKFFAYSFFYYYLARHHKTIDIVWLPVWDYKFIDVVLKLLRFRGKVVYHVHELEPKKYKYCKRVDKCVVPEENRGWILKFLSGINSTPLILPNIPYLDKGLIKQSPINDQFDISGKKIVLYQGLINFEKRCIDELIQSIRMIDDLTVVLAIMPMPGTADNLLDQVRSCANKNNVLSRIFILDSLNPPNHLDVIRQVHLGIGLYRPTSLNQVYAAPNRLYEFLNFSIPIILPEFPHFKYLETKFPFAVNCVNVENPKTIANKIINVLESQNYSKGKLSAKKFYKEEADYNKYGSEILKYLID